MVFLSRFNSIGSKVLIVIVILMCHTSAEEPAPVTTVDSTIASEPTVDSTIAPVTTVDSTIAPVTTVASTIAPVTTVDSTFDTIETSSETGITENVTSTSVPSSTAPIKCYPNQFPFGDECMSAKTSAAVVITALVLSVISFAGALGVFSYMLLRKFVIPRGGHIRANNDVELGKLSKVSDDFHFDSGKRSFAGSLKGNANGTNEKSSSNLYDEPTSNGNQVRKAAANPRVAMSMDDGAF